MVDCACSCCPKPGDIRWDTAVEVIVGGLTDDERRKLAGIQEGATKNSAGDNIVIDENGAISVAESVVEAIASKADDVTFNTSTRLLQLTANGEPIGEGVILPDGAVIARARVNEDGDLIITYGDGESENVGHVVGAPGKEGQVYVPHIDADDILSWTIEDIAGEIPTPIDLDPEDHWQPVEKDEWGDANDDGQTDGRSDYEWGSINE